MIKYHIKRFIISLFYPNRCPICDKIITDSEYFCSDCVDKIPLFETSFVPKYYDEFSTVTVYDNEARDLILQLKYHNNGYAIAAAARMIYEIISTKDCFAGIDYITCVPSGKDSMKSRGYNQSELIAREIADMSGKKYKNFFVKDREVGEQKKLSAAERKLNVVGAYSLINGVNVAGKNILVIDDVCTTGSTLVEIGKILRENGVDFLFSAVFATTQKNT